MIDPLEVKLEILKGNLVLRKGIDRHGNKDAILLCDGENGEAFVIGRISLLEEKEKRAIQEATP